MKSLIILADLGRVKAYRITHDDLDPKSSPAFEDVLDVDLENQHSRVSDRYSDKAGRFSYGPGSKAVGEKHSEQAEAEVQQLKGVAQSINEAAKTDTGDIFFAAPREIVKSLLDKLEPSIRKRIRSELPLNLVKVPKLKLLERFAIA